MSRSVSLSHPILDNNAGVTELNFTAKNIALAGVKTVTVYDPSPIEIADLGTQVSYFRWYHEALLILSSSCEKPISVNPEQKSLHQD